MSPYHNNQLPCFDYNILKRSKWNSITKFYCPSRTDTRISSALTCIYIFFIFDFYDSFSFYPYYFDVHLQIYHYFTTVSTIKSYYSWCQYW